MPLRDLSKKVKEKVTSVGKEQDWIESVSKSKNVVNPDAPSLKIIKMGSDVGATKNMTVYECGDEIIVVDCGIGFPDADLPGVDVVIPDVSYLVENKHKVKGIVVTHGHEDHFGAIPYIIDQLDVPIYANILVQEFLKDRLSDKATEQTAKAVQLHTVNSNTKDLSLGNNFKLSAFRVNHSVPDSLGFAIKTPQGTIMHMADYKIDWSPVLDKPIELDKIAAFGNEGVLCLLSDCLLASKDGFSQSEQILKPTYDYLFENAQGKQIFLTTISTNISRMAQVIESAVNYGRKIVFVGRSISSRGDIARRLGYLDFPEDVFVPLKKVKEYEPDEILYIIAGCYGQENSALYRLAQNDHNQLQINEGDLVIFSADPGPPSSYEPVENVLHYLTVAGAEVIYSDIQDNLHVSGHGLRGDLMAVASMAKAKYFIPIGGTAARMRAYTHMVEEIGVPKANVFELLEGESVIFENGVAKDGEKYHLEQVYIEGRGANQVGEVVLRDRERLSDDGIFVVMVPVSGDRSKVIGSAEVVTRGFVYVKENKALVGKAKDVVNKILDKNRDEIGDWNGLTNKVEKELERYLMDQTGKKPLIIVSSISI